MNGATPVVQDGLVRGERVDVDVDAPRCMCCTSTERPILAARVVMSIPGPPRYLPSTSVQCYWTAGAEWREAVLDADLIDGSSLESSSDAGTLSPRAPRKASRLSPVPHVMLASSARPARAVKLFSPISTARTSLSQRNAPRHRRRCTVRVSLPTHHIRSERLLRPVSVAAGTGLKREHLASN